MYKMYKIFFIVFLGITICYGVYAWSESVGSLPNNYLIPINTSEESQEKYGGLTIGQDLNVVGSSNICQLKTGNCPSGYYSSDGVIHGTYRICCKVN